MEVSNFSDFYPERTTFGGRTFPATGKLISNYEYGGTDWRYDLDLPKGLIINKGDLYIADKRANKVVKIENAARKPSIVPIYRLYFHGAGKHLFTNSENEYNTLGASGWRKAGVAYYLYDKHTTVSGEGHLSASWLRLYNFWSGTHFYTNFGPEYVQLSDIGWSYKGRIGYMLRDQHGATVPLFRLYNPNNRSHYWTVNAFEKATLVSLGWKGAGIAGYVYKTKPD